MAAIFKLTTGIAYVRGWTGSISGGTLQLADDSVSAPSLTNDGDTDTGLFFPQDNSVALGGNGTEYLRIRTNSVNVGIQGSVGLGASANTADVILERDAANTLALRNGTNAQNFRVYGTTTGSKYLGLAHNGTDAVISTTAGALKVDGSAGELAFQTSGATR